MSFRRPISPVVDTHARKAAKPRKSDQHRWMDMTDRTRQDRTEKRTVREKESKLMPINCSSAVCECLLSPFSNASMYLPSLYTCARTPHTRHQHPTIRPQCVCASCVRTRTPVTPLPEYLRNRSILMPLAKSKRTQQSPPACMHVKATQPPPKHFHQPPHAHHMWCSRTAVYRTLSLTA